MTLENAGAPLPAAVMTIFGATGDLTKRLLLPSIYNLAANHVLPDGFRLLGVAMDDWDDGKFKGHIASTLKQFWGSDVDGSVVDWLTSRAGYQAGNFEDPASFVKVKQAIEAIEAESKSGGNRLFYLAIAPSFIATVTSLLSNEGLLKEDERSWRRLVIEKPFGHDLASAIALNKDLQTSLREDQIYRIDHFAGKDSVQDLAVFRFANAILEPLWNRTMIDHVQITAAETVGVEGRAGFYEKSGALRDMVPNHLAQVLSLVAMEPPVSFDAEHMRSKQVELLQSVRKLKPEDVAKAAVRGQYGAGSVAGQSVPGYREEGGVSPSSNTETYVALRAEIDNWRWAGVPFYLRTGKRLSRAVTEIILTFRKPPESLFPNTKEVDKTPNSLLLNLQPNPGIDLLFEAKQPGLITTVEQVSMTFKFPDGPFGKHAKGYERLLHDVMAGDPALFQRAEFVEEGWRMVQPLIDAWAAPEQNFPNYAAGSNGPAAADELLAADGNSWRSLEEK
jgi:glucose-6-phosphate 1-dehydrogenase